MAPTPHDVARPNGQTIVLFLVLVCMAGLVGYSYLAPLPFLQGLHPEMNKIATGCMSMLFVGLMLLLSVSRTPDTTLEDMRLDMMQQIAHHHARHGMQP